MRRLFVGLPLLLAALTASAAPPSLADIVRDLDAEDPDVREKGKTELGKWCEEQAEAAIAPMEKAMEGASAEVRDPMAQWLLVLRQIPEAKERIADLDILELPDAKDLAFVLLNSGQYHHTMNGLNVGQNHYGWLLNRSGSRVTVFATDSRTIDLTLPLRLRGETLAWSSEPVGPGDTVAADFDARTLQVLASGGTVPDDDPDANVAGAFEGTWGRISRELWILQMARWSLQRGKTVRATQLVVLAIESALHPTGFGAPDPPLDPKVTLRNAVSVRARAQAFEAARRGASYEVLKAKWKRLIGRETRDDEITPTEMMARYDLALAQGPEPSGDGVPARIERHFRSEMERGSHWDDEDGWWSVNVDEIKSMGDAAAPTLLDSLRDTRPLRWTRSDDMGGATELMTVGEYAEIALERLGETFLQREVKKLAYAEGLVTDGSDPNNGSVPVKISREKFQELAREWWRRKMELEGKK